MSITESLHHILELTLSFLRHNKPSGFVESKQSITTPLGQIGYKRIVDTMPSTREGVRRARTREYAIRPSKGTDDKNTAC
jgi:hypothetical protein